MRSKCLISLKYAPDNRSDVHCYKATHIQALLYFKTVGLHASSCSLLEIKVAQVSSPELHTLEWFSQRVLRFGTGFEICLINRNAWSRVV